MLEAWLGAMYSQEENVGLGLQYCHDFIINIIETHIDFVQLITEDDNYKDQLLQAYQALYHSPPTYKEIDAVGPPHSRIFTIGVFDPNGTLIAQTTGPNKKMAEQECAKLALELLNSDRK
jgi:hypothetical protein